MAGRQIVTKEKLEVLALTTDRPFEEGTPIQDTLESVLSVGGIPVIPWGFGKWWGKRGKILTDLLQSQTAPGFSLGDNSGRPGFLPYPSQFEQAQKKGIRILPGSDPLPFPTEYWRPCSVGFAVTGKLHDETPATDLRAILKNPNSAFFPYMQLEHWPRFFKNQLAMQIAKRQAR